MVVSIIFVSTSDHVLFMFQLWTKEYILFHSATMTDSLMPVSSNDKQITLLCWFS